MRKREDVLWAGMIIRITGGRLSKRIVFGNLEGAVWREWGGKEKEWTDCVQCNGWAFDRAGDWKTTALEAQRRGLRRAEGRRKLMAEWMN